LSGSHIHASGFAGGIYRIHGLIGLYEVEEFPGIDPVSRTNRAAAFDNISRSNRNCLFSRRNRVISARSGLRKPSWRWPWSRCDWAIPARIVWAVGSNSWANSYWARPSCASSMSYRRNSGG